MTAVLPSPVGRLHDERNCPLMNSSYSALCHGNGALPVSFSKQDANTISDMATPCSWTSVQGLTACYGRGKGRRSQNHHHVLRVRRLRPPAQHLHLLEAPLRQ